MRESLRLDTIVDRWLAVLAKTAREDWVADFRDRYVNLSLSEAACTSP